MVLKQNENETMASDEGSDSATFWIKNNSEASGLEIFLFFLSWKRSRRRPTRPNQPLFDIFFNFSNLAFFVEKKLFRNFDVCASAGKNFKNDV